MDYRSLLGAVAAVVNVASFIPYFRDIFRGRTKPHVFSWFAWGLLTGIAFFAQIVEGGSAGAWITGLTAAICFSIAVLALSRGEKNITRSDWMSFIGALLGIALWRATSDPFAAVIVVVLTDVLAFVPTFRKSFSKPHEETAAHYALSTLAFLISLPALTEFNSTTALYPASIALMDGGFFVMVLIRRRSLSSVTV